MNLFVSRLRAPVYRVGRALFRSLPLSEGQRDRLRATFLARYHQWIPQPQKGQLPADGAATRQLRVRADEPAIGHQAYRKAVLPDPMPAKLVAFYLPQFHTFAENDAWWGKGFTEWRNVTRALPQFEGHCQPRLPADLGFYDLRNPQVMRDQAKLAQDYGIGAFCFYFYWFDGRSLMESPLRQWLADDSIELPFCLCWANENWARRWDGRDQDILIAQRHSAEDDLAFITHVADYLRDRRALKVDGKPMLLVYRPHLLPDARATATRWRNWCRDNGIGEIHLAYVQGFERPDPRDIGFDAAVEFPPNMSNPGELTASQQLINPDYQGDVRDWRELAADIASRPLPDYVLYPGVNPGWDNEPRRSGRGRTYLHASPRGYRDWLSRTIHDRLKDTPSNQRLVFINAWNEWAEGAVLEPDARLGHAWLEATRQALQPLAQDTMPARPCAIIHATCTEAFASLLAALKAVCLQWRVVVTTTREQRERIDAIAIQSGLNIETHIALPQGRDILPFLEVAERLLDEGEQVVLKLRAESSSGDKKDRQALPLMIKELLAPQSAQRVFEAFQSNPRLGLVAPEGCIKSLPSLGEREAGRLHPLSVRMGLVVTDNTQIRVITGSIFWVRLQALRPVLDSHLPRSLFEVDAAGRNSSSADALESLICLASGQAGYQCIDMLQAIEK